jgi:putative ABC transport system permease protein
MISLFSSVSFAFKRLWTHRGLAACLWLGLVAAVSLAVSVPLYADAVSYNLLEASLSTASAESRRPPYSFHFNYIGAWHGPVEADRYQTLDAFLTGQAPGLIGLPLYEGAQGDISGGITRLVSSETFQLYPPGETLTAGQRLEMVRLSFLSGVFEQIRIIDGALPSQAPTGGGPVEAIVSLKLANDLGLEIGQTYRLYRPAQAGSPPVQVPVRLVGVWLPLNPSSEFWFYPPESFEKRFLVTEEAFFAALDEFLPNPVGDAVWRLSFDGSSVRSEDVPGLLARIGRVQNQAAGLLPNTTLDVSPVPALRQYRRQAVEVTNSLFLFSAPVMALILYFLGLAAGMLVARQRGEIAVLRGRGASRRWVAAIYLLEWGLLGAAALAVGPFLGMALAGLFGQAGSFLDFSLESRLPLRLTWGAIACGGAAAVLAVAFSVWPAWIAGRDTIVSYKQEQARNRRRPLWQRAYLDLLLFIPALYGLYTLQQSSGQGTLRILGRTLQAADPFENPLLFLLPTLFMLAGSLLAARLLPHLLAGLAWLAARLPWTTPVLALRQVSRSFAGYMGPLALMALTLSLSVFVASMAAASDRALEAGVYYSIGADLNLVENAEFTGETGSPGGFPGSPTPANPGSPEERGVWNLLPVSDHLGLPGVEAAARIGRYEAELNAGGRRASGRLVGLDRTDFPAVAYFRDDFAPEPLGSLMNRLALDPAALLVDRATWERLNLAPGDRVQLQVGFSGERRMVPFTVAGLLDYFPSLYPADGPFFIANLEYIFEAFEGLLPYDVWLRTAPEAGPAEIYSGINRLGGVVLRSQDARQALELAYRAPSRQGVLGLLSAGFLAAALLAVAGFTLFALLSFHQRYIQLGAMRAIGLSARQMATALALEQSILVAAAMLAGTATGVLAAYLFIPHLPMTGGSRPDILPAFVEIAWVEIGRLYLVFGLMLASGLTAALASLRRMKIFQAVKLGETV